MNVLEFSEQWDILYNNIASNAAPGLTEYEKSIFLTQAQKEVVIGLYNGTLGYGFEQVEENRKYLAPLVRTETLSEGPIEDITDLRGFPQYSVERGLGDFVRTASSFYRLPKDLWFITYESARFSEKENKTIPKCLLNRDLDVIPVTQDMYHKIRNNPFRGANDRKVLRLDVVPYANTSNDSASFENHEVMAHVVELISTYKIGEYLVRYIRHPRPIILEDIDTYTPAVEGQRESQTSELNPILHKIILEIAINKAYNIRPN